MSRRTALAAISPVASEQWGMITAGQARRAGVSRQDLGRLVGDGTLAVAGQAVDVFFTVTDADVDDAVDAPRAALRIDLSDHFDFDVTRVAPLHEEARCTCVR